MVALFELADALHRRAGEGAALVAEEFAFEQLLGDGRAVHGQERLRAAVAVMINRARHQFLARAAFAGDERGGVRDGELADQLEHLLHRLAATDDANFIILGFEQRLIRNDLSHVARGLQGVADDFLELRHFERLEQIIVSAQLHRFDGGLGRAVRRHENDQLLGIQLPDAAQCLHAADAAHADIHEHEVRLQLGNQLQPVLPAGGGGQLDFRRFDIAPDGIQHVRIVIN